MQNSQSLNRYSYVQGNPINFNDPFGMSPNDNYKWGSFWDRLKAGYGGIFDGVKNGDFYQVFKGFYDVHESNSYLYD